MTKVLIVNTSKDKGGAARAAMRLHRSFQSIDINTNFLSFEESKHSKVFYKIRKNIGRALLRLYKNRSQTLFSHSLIPCSPLVKNINSFNADIVHLHWVQDEILPISQLKKIKAPIVWSLHDMWAFTGGCHYDEECGAFKNECGECPVLQSHKKRDLSSFIFNLKKDQYSKIKSLNIVGLSSWMKESAQSSSLLKDKRVVNIPNPIDTKTFSPGPKEREKWNLPHDKKIICFGAMGATSDLRKGFLELSKAIHMLEYPNIEIAIFGADEPKSPPSFPFKTHYLGMINNDEDLVSLYRTIDLMIVPSLQENLSNAIMESLSCSTPVVAFDIGGNKDMIEHQSNGYLAKKNNVKDLAHGVQWCLNSPSLREQARNSVLSKFDQRIVAKRYIDLYQEVISESN